MSTTISFAGTNYSIPAYGDTGWAQGSGNLSSYLIAIANGTVQTTGGTFTLSANLNFGSSYGLIAPYYISSSSNPATAGVLRLAVGDTIDWGTGNLALGISGSSLEYAGNVILTTAIFPLAIADGGTGAATTSQNYIFAGPASGSGAPSFRAMVAGDVPTLNQNTTGSSGSCTGSSGSCTGNSVTATTAAACSGNAATATTAGNVTGTVAIANGGTGQTTASAAINALLPSRTRQVFTSGSAQTYTTPAGARQLFIRMVGGGGGGAAANTNNGSAGGTTIFNSINANGGGGGVTGGFGSAGGAGGSGGSGSASLRIPGQSGQSSPLGPSNVGVGGAGGNSILGFGAPGTQANAGNVAGIAAPSNSGAGGSSGATSSSGGGGGGGEYVEIIINSPSATYTYTIGAAGGGGAAGTEAGGNGGLGIIIVDEYY